MNINEEDYNQMEDYCIQFDALQCRSYRLGYRRGMIEAQEAIDEARPIEIPALEATP